jgi:hypothetical protein
MMKNGRLLLWLAMGAMVGTAVCGQGGEKQGLARTKAGERVAQSANFDTSPVTLAEVHATGDRLERAIRRIVFEEADPKTSRATPEDRAAKRHEIVAEFWRLYRLAEPGFKFTPRPTQYDPARLTVEAGHEMRKPLETMLKQGFLGKVAPIPAGKEETITIAEYGDALGFFMARMSELTHTPNTRWSPYLFGHIE